MCPPPAGPRFELTGALWPILATFAGLAVVAGAVRWAGVVDVAMAISGAVALVTVTIVGAHALIGLLSSRRPRRRASTPSPPLPVAVHAWTEDPAQDPAPVAFVPHRTCNLCNFRNREQDPPALDGARPALEPSNVWLAEEWQR